MDETGAKIQFFNLENLKKQDTEIFNAVAGELNRQRNVIELIASENIVSKAVLETTGSVLTNKYAEGYPKKRYYGGNEFIDICEELAIERAKKLFSAEHANVQPHSGSTANAEAFFSVLNIGDKILAQSLEHGGHLTHGHKVNFSGKFYNFEHYGVDKETEMIDMDAVRKKAIEFKPKMILAGASAYPRKIDFKEFREIADEIGAYLMTDMAHIAGLVATKLHPDCVKYSDIVTTTTHKTLRGPRGALILSKTEDRFDKEEKASKKNLSQKIDSAVFPGMQGGPLEHVIAAKAVCFMEAMKPEFKEYQNQVLKNAKAMTETLLEKGFRIVSGGTDNHLILIDLTNKNTTGKEVEEALDKAGITLNKNMIPFDKRSPFNPSGIRIGTPAITSRGFKEEEAKQTAEIITKVIDSINTGNLANAITKAKEETVELCRRFSIY